jgi:hypothetical protein
MIFLPFHLLIDVPVLEAVQNHFICWMHCRLLATIRTVTYCKIVLVKNMKDPFMFSPSYTDGYLSIPRNIQVRLYDNYTELFSKPLGTESAIYDTTK